MGGSEVSVSSPPRGSYISIRIDTGTKQSSDTFSSPPRGSYISIYELITDELYSACSRPLHGVLIFQYSNTYSSIFHARSRPIHGVLIFQCTLINEYRTVSIVLVPSTGFLYFNPDPLPPNAAIPKCSRPLHGVLIFQSCFYCFYVGSLCSRPLHGVLIFQFNELYEISGSCNVLVPSTGFLYFNLIYVIPNRKSYVLVPSTGFLYFNMLWSTEGCAGKKGFSSPPRGSYISIF